MINKFSGTLFFLNNKYNEGISFLCDKSPEAPKITKPEGPAFTISHFIPGGKLYNKFTD